jgi:YbbR domain-containing protein
MIKKKLKQAKRDYWVLRVIALVFSIFLWIAVIGGKKGEITKEVSIDYRLREGTMLANNAPKAVSFRVRGPRAFLKEMEEKEIRLPLDLSQMSLGDNDILLSEDMLEVPLGIEVIGVLPKQVSLSVDNISKKRVTVRPMIQANLPEGFKLKSVSSNPSTVEIKGPRRTLRFMDSLPTEEIKIDASSAFQEYKVKPNLVDFPGVSLAENVDSIYLSVNLDGPTSRKTFTGIPVKLKIGEGKSAKELGPSNTKVFLQPMKVSMTLEGSQALIEKMNIANIEVWAELPEWSKGKHRLRVLWQLPPQVKVIQRSTDYIVVRIL